MDIQDFDQDATELTGLVVLPDGSVLAVLNRSFKLFSAELESINAFKLQDLNEACQKTLTFTAGFDSNFNLACAAKRAKIEGKYKHSYEGVNMPNFHSWLAPCKVVVSGDHGQDLCI